MTNATPSFLSTVANLHWDHFVLPRIGYNEEIVREFYAGITEVEGPKKTYTSKVRGKIVQFHPRKINEHYMLKYNGFDFEKRVGYSSMREMEEIRSRIATPDSVWEKFSSKEIKLRSTYLIDTLGNWHLFICTSVLPTSHTYAMTKERLILLDTILSEENVDIGRLIAREIYTCITKKKGFLFFPCLITELCMKAAVPIYENEHTKFLSNNLKVEIKGKLKKAKGPQPMPMPKPMPKPMPMPMPKPMPAMQEHFMQKQAAVWKFQNEQHDWLQLIFHHMSTELGNIEAPVFPSWVLRTQGKEDEEKEEEEKEETDEEEEEKEEETDKEVEEEEEQKLRKKVTRKQAKGKKKVVIEPELEETYDSESEEEDEELEKEMDEDSEEEEEESDEPGSEEEERARNVIIEEIARQKYTSPTKSPAKTPTESPITSPAKEPSPPLKSPPVQSPPHSPPPPSPTKPEQPMPQSPSIITANVVSDLEKELVQEREEEGLDKEEGPEAEAEAEAVQTDAPAPGASASQKTATTKHDEAAITLVLEAMAKSKKEELGNTQKFFKTPALKKQTAKRKISEAKSTDAPASVPASTTEETDASAPAEETPTKPSKEKKLKVKHTAPTRQSSRTRSGAKK